MSAWTSSNKDPFLAIVIIFIPIYIILSITLTSLKFPEELLIDFCELIGKHYGANMGHAVHETMKMYNLQGKVNHLFLMIYLGDELN